MEQMIVNAVGTLAFGGGGIAIVSYFAHQQFKILSDYHKAAVERVCDSFDREMDRRDKNLERMLAEIQAHRSGILKNE